MPKRKNNNKKFAYNLPEQKKSRFGVLADFDDGDRKDKGEKEVGTSEELNADEKVENLLNNAQKKQQEGKKPNVYINKDELTMNDIARMCHTFVAKNECSKPIWMVFNKFKQPGQMVLTRINCTEEQLIDEKKQLTFVEKFSKGKWVPINAEVLNSFIYWEKLTHVYVPKREQLKRFFETQKDPLKELHSDDVLKLALLTTTEEMAGLNYPLHGFEGDDIPGVAPVMATKDQYAKVTKDSPIFVLDCEMCVTSAGVSELTRATLIDEAGQTLLDTFVKPFNKIVDYVTCFSGVTSESLKGCSTTLYHVQEAFRRILPPDAILCGHSIENDLRALRLSHPYCIDVGFAYNMLNKKIRTSLRGLMYYYFNERIQSSDLGHCSYEDAWAALRLLKLKLENGLSFGSISLGFDYVEWAKSKKFTDSAQLFQLSSAKDFAKDPAREVKLPEPREIGKCLMCDVSIKSQCFIGNCLCVQKMAKYCCICAGKDIKHEELTEDKCFNFGKALSCLQEVSYRPTLQEALKRYRKPAKAMIAKYLTDTESAEEMSDKNFHPMPPHRTIEAHDRAISSITQRICGIIALQSGFHTSSIMALTRLSEMALSHMNEICRLTKKFCENTGRSIPIDKDVELALRYLNVDEGELADEILKLRRQSKKFPALQVRSTNPPNQPKTLHVDPNANRPGHIPAFLPPFPDPHTYTQTEISCEPDVSYPKHRDMCAEHQKTVDNQLMSFLTKRYPTISLYGKMQQNGTNPKEHVKRGLILKPFDDPRPYLSALLPPDSLEELEY